jgi:hypothetical protein
MKGIETGDVAESDSEYEIKPRALEYERVPTRDVGDRDYKKRSYRDRDQGTWSCISLWNYGFFRNSQNVLYLSIDRSNGLNNPNISRFSFCEG